MISVSQCRSTYSIKQHRSEIIRSRPISSRMADAWQLTVDELKTFNGKSACSRILVALNGKVFDVTQNGAKFYGPGGPYEVFAGRDASRGLATMSLTTVSDQNDDLADLTDTQRARLFHWEKQFSGKSPTSVRGPIFGANLLAIAKKFGGIRPIAVGYVWCRLAAKVACSHVKETSVALLAPRQLGFGIKHGAEVRAARSYLENMERGQVFMKIDSRNAFNMLRRDSILEAVAKHFPELLQYAASTMVS